MQTILDKYWAKYKDKYKEYCEERLYTYETSPIAHVEVYGEKIVRYSDDMRNLLPEEELKKAMI